MSNLDSILKSRNILAIYLYYSAGIFFFNTCKSKETDGEDSGHLLAKAKSIQSAICLND